MLYFKPPNKKITFLFGFFNSPTSAIEVISIDGKSMRDTREYGSKTIVHMVSAWATENHIVPGQLKVGEKSNEITAIPKLLDLPAVSVSEDVDWGHGRIETRRCPVIDDLSLIENREEWKNLRSLDKDRDGALRQVPANEAEIEQVVYQ